MKRNHVVGWLSLAAILLAGSAWADGIPSPANSTSPAFIRLVGSNNGVPDAPTGHFTVVMRDVANNPMPGVVVLVDLSRCADLRIASDQLAPNLVVDCNARTVSTTTDAAGVATMTVLGNAVATGSSSGIGCARIFGNGELLSSPITSAFDLNGANGIDIGDLSLWLGDLSSGTYRARSDYDGSGTVSVPDLSVWFGALGGNRSKTTGVVCP